MSRKLRTALLALIVLGLAPGYARAAEGAALPATTIAARQHFFGAENVNAAGEVRSDRVILSWFSVSSFAAAMDGHVVLLDSYIHKGEDVPGYVPTTTNELVALAPEVIFIGHGHFDHAATAGEIAARTGATLVGTPEHCGQATEEAAAFGAEHLNCVFAADPTAPPGTTRELRPLGDGIEVTALKNIHSATEPPDGHVHETSIIAGAVPDPNQILLHPPGPSVLPGLNPAGDEGGTMLYQFRIGGFSLVWHDSAGPLRERGPQVFDAMRALPPTDVQVGATLGFNDPTNGMRDPVDYVTTLEPDLFFPSHHDFIAEYGASKALEGVFMRELDQRDPVGTEVHWLYDPYDYLRPSLMSFEVDAPAFSDRLRVRVRPRRIPVGERTTLRVRVRASGGPVSSARVRFGHRRARTDGRGRARLRVLVREAGWRNLVAAATGVEPDRARVRIRRPRSG